LKNFLILVTTAILNGERDCRTPFWKETIPAKFDLIWFSRCQEVAKLTCELKGMLLLNLLVFISTLSSPLGKVFL